MNHRKPGHFFVFLLLWSSLGAAKPAGTILAKPLPARDRMVVVISLDGFPAYYLSDPKLPAPTLRKLIATGSWASEMTPINPTWTWPNHTTLVTGLEAKDHGLLYNGELIRTDNPLTVKIDPSIPKTDMVRCPTVYDIAHRAGLTTAQVDWVAINDAPTITWAFPEKANASDALVREMIADHALQAGDVEGKADIVWRDQVWTKAGAYLIRKHRPNLLLFHLLTLDSTHHNYGPRTLASADAVGFLDSCVRSLIDAVKDSGMLDRTTFIVLSDHGFKAVQKKIFLNDLLAKARSEADVRGIAEGGSAMIYVSKNHRAESLEQLRVVLSQTEGVQRVVDETGYAELGFPLPSRDSQMPDLVAFAKPSYSFAGGSSNGGPIVATAPATIGAHGYINSDPEMQAIFIANGYGIRPGIRLDKIANTAVAPTLAYLLGVSLPKTEQPAIKQILQ